MTARSITLMLFVTSAFAIACEGTRVTESVQALRDPAQPAPDPWVFTTLEVVPSNVELEQGSMVQLGVFAPDQRGKLITDATGAAFSSSDPAIAQVSGSGLVMGVAAGTADISVTKTVAGVTRSAAVKATIRKAIPSDNLVITADSRRGWQPPIAHLTAGGTVKWVTAGPISWSGIPHGRLYLMDKGYAVVDSLDLSTGFATLTFPTEGDYWYCSGACWDPPDYGIVYVHRL